MQLREGDVVTIQLRDGTTYLIACDDKRKVTLEKKEQHNSQVYWTVEDGCTGGEANHTYFHLKSIYGGFLSCDWLVDKMGDCFYQRHDQAMEYGNCGHWHVKSCLEEFPDVHQFIFNKYNPQNKRTSRIIMTFRVKVVDAIQTSHGSLLSILRHHERYFTSGKRFHLLMNNTNYFINYMGGPIPGLGSLGGGASSNTGSSSLYNSGQNSNSGSGTQKNGDVRHQSGGFGNQLYLES